MKGLSRREFIRASALVSAASLAAACTPAPAAPPAEPVGAAQPTAAPAAPAAAPSGYQQAPMLDSLVEQGLLPAVEDRIPVGVQVLTPVDEVGQYGGTIRTAIGNVNQLFGDPQGIIGTELVLRIAPDFVSVTGGLFETWEFNEDATEQVLHLRKGLRWSDGEPMTTQDCLFDWQDCKLNEELYPAGPPAAWRVGKDRTPMVMEAIDDYTLKLTFAEPYPLITLQECFYAGCQWGGMFAPKHYGMQFHPAYADADELAQKIKDAGFERWTELIGDKMRVGSTIPAQVDLPGMTAYIRTADSPDHHTYERNPYYWKVDTAGNQLPYIDKVVVSIISDKELMTARLVAGDLDFIGHSAYLKNMALYQSSLESANLKIVMWDSTLPSAVIIYPNHTAKDPDIREFFGKTNVRIAMSLSMDRDEVNNVAHFGLGQVRQWAMWPSSQYYIEGDETHYIEYDPEEANRLLDEEGYTERDADGYRLFPSGKRIGWQVEYDPEQGDIAPTMELCILYFQDIGIELTIKPTNRQLLDQLFAANDLVMTTWQGDISDINWPANARAVIPGRANHTWARAWEAWLWTPGQFPDLEEEPPQWVKDQYDDYMLFNRTVDAQERVVIARRMWDRYYEWLPCFGSVGVPQPVVMKKNIRNFPAWGQWGFSVIRSVPVNPETLYFQQ